MKYPTPQASNRDFPKVSPPLRVCSWARSRAACTLGSAVLLGLLLAPQALAQVIHGSVRVKATSLPIEGATVSIRDRDGGMLAAVVTDPLGDFSVRVAHSIPITIEVRRLGYSLSRSEIEPLQLADTVEFEILMNEIALTTDAVRVTAEPGINDRRLQEASRRGWKIFDPEIVMVHRGRAQDFHQLLRSLGNPGLIFPRSQNECIRATRNNRCLTYVVDNQVWGTTAIILPTDVYFIAILSASESRVQFGDRAPFGAIAVYTRSHTDRVQPPAPVNTRNAARPRP